MRERKVPLANERDFFSTETAWNILLETSAVQGVGLELTQPDRVAHTFLSSQVCKSSPDGDKYGE